VSLLSAFLIALGYQTPHSNQRMVVDVCGNNVEPRPMSRETIACLLEGQILYRQSETIH
jgi:hypothetical protein